MKRWTLLSVLILCLACAGDTEPADGPAEPTPPPAGNATTDEQPGESPAGSLSDGVDAVVGTAPPAVVIPEDWKRINEYTQMFYDGDLEQLHALFSDEAKTEMPLAILTEMHAKMLAELGEESAPVGFSKEENDGYLAYKRAARFSSYPELVEVAWVIAPDDSIYWLVITPQQPGSE